MADMISVVETIEREIAMREAGQKVCNYLVISEPVYRALREDIINRSLQYVEPTVEVTEFHGMTVIRLDRHDYILVIG